MTVSRFDHVAVPIECVDAMAAFYRSLGFRVEEHASDEGAPIYISVHFGLNKINMHAPAGALAIREVRSAGTDGGAWLRGLLLRLGRECRVDPDEAGGAWDSDCVRAGGADGWREPGNERLRARPGLESAGVHRV